ncbi:MAG: hypothetical protein WDM92_03755 [Caulobacteraceae bacterium]
MRILAGLTIITALGVAGVASAETTRLSDVAYMQAARCAGLASSGKLDAADAGAIKALVRSQSAGRMPYVQDKADEIQQSAKREADHADDSTKAKLSAELSGACASLKS